MHLKVAFECMYAVCNAIKPIFEISESMETILEWKAYRRREKNVKYLTQKLLERFSSFFNMKIHLVCTKKLKFYKFP